MIQLTDRPARRVWAAALAAGFLLTWQGGLAAAPNALPAASAERVAQKLPFVLPPSAELQYAVRASQHGLTLSGQSLLSWQVQDRRYQINSETRANLFGKIIESTSEGAIDEFGLAPHSMQEKRVRKSATTTTFRRDSKLISFSESAETYPIKGGEQDRSSVLWQLLAQARARPEKMTDGAQWTFFVAGRRDAEPWTFRVGKAEQISTPLGMQTAIHLVKAPPPDSQDQRLDLWLAPGLEWYPVKLRFTEHDGDYIEQTLEKIGHK